MLEHFHTLITFAERGTMQRTALALHVTQSTVSKRIAELERRLNRKLIESRGRKSVLTSEGARLVSMGKGVLDELMSVLNSPSISLEGGLSLEMATSVLTAGGADALAEVQRALPDVKFDLRCNHSSVAIERVRSGDSMLAVCHCRKDFADTVRGIELYDQELVIVPASLQMFSLQTKRMVEVLAIESFTDAWQETKRQLIENSKAWKVEFEVHSEFQSFSAILHMAKAGFGHGIVPRQLARAQGIPDKKLLRFPGDGIKIPVKLVAREKTLHIPRVLEFVRHFKSAIQKIESV